MATSRVKYPRTLHLPSSLSKTSDDKLASEELVKQALGGKRVIITEKMDGEATTIYWDGYSHARSIDSNFHPSRTIVKELAATIAHQLPEKYRICGENLFATHSIHYKELASYFQVYNIWGGERCLSWDETLEWSSLLELTTVPVIYDGLWRGEAHAMEMWRSYEQLHEEVESEGFVVRVAHEFAWEEFSSSLFKMVRSNHVQTGAHWAYAQQKPNGLRQS